MKKELEYSTAKTALYALTPLFNNKMRLHSALLLLTLLISCKKSDDAPKSSDPTYDPSLFIYRTVGFKSFDTVQITINGAIKFTSPSGYNVEIKRGDQVGIFIVARMDSTINEHNFAIWKNENATPDKSIKYFYPTLRYSNKFLIQGSFVAP